MMFAGLRSRWMMPTACASSRDSQIIAAMRAARGQSSRPPAAFWRSRRVFPSTYSIERISMALFSTS